LRRAFSGWFTATGFGLVLFAAIGSLTWPSARDQSIFEWFGGVILDGGVPYRDAWDLKGPLSYYVYALAMAVFGRHEYTIRILDLAAILTCCWLLRRLVMRLNGAERFGANCAAIFFALTYLGGGFWNTAQPDAWAGMLILIVVMLLLHPPWKAHWTLAVAGGIVALATLLKPSFLIFLALPLFFPTRQPANVARTAAALAACLVAFVSILVATMLSLSRVSGGLQDFADVLCFIFVSHSTVETRHPLVELSEFPGMLLRLGLLIPTVLVPFGIVLLRRAGPGFEARVIAAWVVLALLAVVAQGKYWFYHWTPAMIALAPIVGVVVTHFARQTARESLTPLRDGAVLVVACLATIAPPAVRALLHSYAWPGYILGIQDRAQYSTHFTAPDGWSYPKFTRLAGYISDHSGPNDTVLMWGWDLLVNELSERKPPTRFGFSYPLVAAGPLQAKFRHVFLDEIERLPPRYIVIAAQERWAMTHDSSGLELLHGFPEFNQLLDTRYRLVSDTEGYQLWSRSP
jgi:hypothetical protein